MVAIKYLSLVASGLGLAWVSLESIVEVESIVEKFTIRCIYLPT